MKRKDVPKNANIITTRMVLSAKDVGAADEQYKALVAVHGHRDL